MKKSAQQSFEKIHWRHRYSHGGTLRRERVGRSARPLSTRDSIHLVFKANREVVRGGFRQSRRFALIHHLVQKYKFKFYVKVEQLSIQGDHLHLLIRTTRRSNYQSFFRVVAGQIAQQFEKEGLLTATFTGVGVTKSESIASNPPIPVFPGVSVTSQRTLAQNANVTDTPKVWAKVQILRGERSQAAVVTDTPARHKVAGAARIAGKVDSQQNDYQMEVGPGSSEYFWEKSPDRYRMEVATSTSEVEGVERGIMDKSIKPQRLWKYRPFTRVVKSYRAYMTVRNYIQLNEKEALQEIPYQKRRLKGLSSSEWEVLWV